MIFLLQERASIPQPLTMHCLHKSCSAAVHGAPEPQRGFREDLRHQEQVWLLS